MMADGTHLHTRWTLEWLLHDHVFNNSWIRWSQVKGGKHRHLEYVCLALICVLAIIIRLFPLIRGESVIFGFDPYFCYRTTRILSEKGIYYFWNWFDDRSWYPLGRVVGQTLFPGIMVTAHLLHQILVSVGILVSVKDVCIYVAPAFSCLTVISSFLLGKDASKSTACGLLAAFFTATCPAYIKASVMGSFDNEAVAIFALVMSLYMWSRAFEKGTMLSAFFAVIPTYYMALSWGGYVFLINILAIYIFALLCMGTFTMRHYIVYSTGYILITIMCVNVPFVNTTALSSSEHMPSHGVFILVTVFSIYHYLPSIIPQRVLLKLRNITIGAVVVLLLGGFLYLNIVGKTGWSPRSLTLLDPTYATKYIPIVASVSEHQPTTWASYLFDLHLTSLLAPLGLIVCFRQLNDTHMIIGIFGILSSYFSGVMIRLMLVLAPAASLLSGIGASALLSELTLMLKKPLFPDRLCLPSMIRAGARRLSAYTVPIYTTLPVILMCGWLCVMYITHCTWASSTAYSQSGVTIRSMTSSGARVTRDDFREAFYWLRQNTDPDSKLLAWWDYGYQLSEVTNRTLFVDNNTWNNTHIATVGLAFSSDEETSFEIMKRLDADYVLVIFGGIATYNSDDLNKLLWMIRIASSEYPHVQQSDYMNPSGMFSVGHDAPPALTQSLMYKLSYYRLAQVANGFDSVRKQTIGVRDIKLKHFREVFTSENWILRIYKVCKSSCSNSF